MKKIIILLFLISSLKGFSQELNSVRLMPVGANDIGTNFGVIYERKLKNVPNLSLVAPLDIKDYVHFNPGLKFYPFGDKKLFNYALGPNALIGYGKNKEEASGTLNVKHLRLGMMFSNYIDINLSKRFVLGADAGFGLLYINKMQGAPNKFGHATQFGLNLGYKF